MKLKLLLISVILFVLLFFSALNSAFAQPLFPFPGKGEIYIKIYIKDNTDLIHLSKIVSIDSKTKPESTNVYAYANKTDFINLLKSGYSFEILKHPADLSNEAKMFSGFFKEIYTWDAYPAYSSYVDLMYSFQNNYSHLCKIHKTGVSVQGRDILFAKITNTLNDVIKPRVLLCSSIHGDEPVGYVTLLRMCDYLLSHYGTDTDITNLLNSVEIWINPLANPDGTYAGGNNTLNGATRFNANYVDLNRNFSDFVHGEHSDGNTTQLENLAVIRLTDSLQFVMGATLHSGAEVLNYPWDNQPGLHADDAWWQYVSKAYADTVFAHSQSGYFTGLSSTGYINGYQWYMISGGKQDYLNYYKHMRELTLEISNTKIPDASLLPYFWEANYRSLINYAKEAQNGIQGLVSDSATNQPIRAKISIQNHDNNNSFVYSDSITGRFFRPIYAGTYDVNFSKNTFQEKILMINTYNGTAAFYSVSLAHTSGMNEESLFSDITIFPNPVSDNILIKTGSSDIISEINLFNLHGISINPKTQPETISGNQFIIDVSTVPSGLYFLKGTRSNKSFVKKINILNKN
ncbi:MAG: hypothetical protein A2275_15845 [Bacteroidetes bacterium RIFOXYA12_FULL_35_11]|nr:MAG: hypothetical protein A2X01_05580 [Bacteroidetes bacterium GWF2_35_48]OFY79196.1 MAG: hypothetical protein A2275_15845 [Bacteroidetes bacterium RIFOXYA12_FULL_35_11]OFY94999.1 MAG: hypothetical protein A2309_10840 [Bacteroidetes bacterium RIFOXYB2_FULL_35_7]